MQFFLGIDGGGTRTRAFAVDGEALISGWGEAGSGNPNHAPPEELRKNLLSAAEAALVNAGADVSSCVSVFAGLAGITTEEGRERAGRLLYDCGLCNARIAVDHDIRIALAGGLGGRPGIALIVGTGSSCYARAADGRTWQTGGWEALISDEGSGYFLGLESMVAAARMADGRTPDSPLREAVFKWLGIRTISEILPRIHDLGISRAEIAAFAPQLIQLAIDGDQVATAILDRGAGLLAEMVEASFRMLPTSRIPEIVITGGLGTADTIYRQKIVAEIECLLPVAEIRDPLLPPAIGAALLALDQAGKPANSEVMSRLQVLGKSHD